MSFRKYFLNQNNGKARNLRSVDKVQKNGYNFNLVLIND